MNFSKLIFQIRSSTRIPLKSPHTHSVSHFLAKMNSQVFTDCSLQIKLMANTFNGKYLCETAQVGVGVAEDKRQHGKR